MRNYKRNNKIKYDKHGCEFKAYHEDKQNAGCSYLRLDHEEHPLLNSDNVEKLGLELIDHIEQFLCEPYSIERGPGTVTILDGDGQRVARVYINGENFKVSDVETVEDAYEIAYKLIECFKRETHESCPVTSCCDTYDIRKDGKVIASFESRELRDEFFKFKYESKYGYKIKNDWEGCNLMNKRRDRANCIVIWDTHFSKDKRTAILSEIREYMCEEMGY